jgi:3-hydroxyacyl-[acyl-carrier-protein] dehydratase
VIHLKVLPGKAFRIFHRKPASGHFTAYSALLARLLACFSTRILVDSYVVPEYECGPWRLAPAVDMRFKLLDRIVELKPGVSITAVKGLALAEDYLADHFPQFPVMPGVFMLEAMTQVSAWLIRVTEDFRHSMVVLREARNVKYADFVAPGQTLTVTAEMLSQTEQETKLKVQGAVDGKLNVSARLVLARFNLADGNPVRASSDAHVIRQMRLQFDLLYRPGGGPPETSTSTGNPAAVNRLVLDTPSINSAAIQ